MMHWIYDYQLFLFDFDGILVNSEELHFLAYKKMCANRGFSLNWDMATYARNAWFSAGGLQKSIYREFPDLFRYEPCWEILSEEKRQAYVDILLNEGTTLMPGVEELLTELEKNNIKRCVVTHSSLEQVAMIRQEHPILHSIPHWITREDYAHPKPSPECYQKAIRELGEEGDQIIGFEDSPRGLKALCGTQAKAVFVTQYFTLDDVKHYVEGDILQVPSLKEFKIVDSQNL